MSGILIFWGLRKHTISILINDVVKNTKKTLSS